MKRIATWGILCCCAALPAYADVLTLTAARTAQPVEVDGTLEEAWRKAVPLKLRLDQLTYQPSSGYPGINETELEIRSLYDEDHVYFVFRWRDPTESLARWPWVKQQDGSWVQSARLDTTGHENVFYEDKFSVAWYLNEKGFPKKGCEQSCHITDNGKIDDIPDGSAGRHFTFSAGEKVDVWHWKALRTGTVGRIDDQLFDHSRDDAREWGRKSDENAGGGYKDNIPEGATAPITKAGSTPKWMDRMPRNNGRYWIRDEDKVPFVDHFKPGDVVAGVIVKPYEGSRGDIQAHSAWKGGYWTLEVKRKRVTNWPKSQEQDVQFDDPAKVHYFGAAVYDNSQINHLFHPRAIAYRFAN